jgi:hypothetical protein
LLPLIYELAEDRDLPAEARSEDATSPADSSAKALMI